jgi:hypothetical protein
LTKTRESNSIAAELGKAGDRESIKEQREKKNYAEALSRGLALRVANALRHAFPGILPAADGRGQESMARTAKGLKRLDVNYSTVQLGLGLGISIKTVNFRDAKTQRYTKNYTRADGELRAEASDYHERQPYAVLIAVVFMPSDACNDAGRQAPSSFGQAVQIFRFRAGRSRPTDAPILFERAFIGLYETETRTFGEVAFFDVMNAPPKSGRPFMLMNFDELIGEIVKTYDQRNKPAFQWAEGESEPVTLPDAEDVEEE